MSARLDRLRDYMAREDIDAVLLTSIHNINYFTGFVYCAFGRSYGLVVTQDRSTTISANIDGGQPWRKSFGRQLVYTDWQRDNYFAAVKELIPVGRRVGVEFDHMSVENHGKLAAALPKAELLDVGVDTMRMRLIKSSEEITLITQGARIADVGGWACVEAIDEGVPEHEVALHSTAAMVREIASTYPDCELMDTWTWFQSGLNTDGAHNPVTTRRILRGDILSLNCFPMISGYYHALERTLFFDSASPRQIALWEVNCEVHRRGIALIVPGARCADIAAELNDIFRDHDLLQYRTFGYGHSFGSLSHYYGREAGLELREDVDTVIEPGMVVSMEPMIMLPEGHDGAGGYREHDILVVTEAGATNITKFPFGPEHNIIRK
jgi:creatinase